MFLRFNSILANLALIMMAVPVFGTEPFDGAPINYYTAAVDDPVSRLQKRIDAGEVTLHFDERRQGYLASVLKELNVPVSSQMLVFSKTSFQRRYISPHAPRAVYFGDDMYVGWVQGGKVLEFSAADPRQGAIFYSLRQKPSGRVTFARHTHECTQCHAGSLTRGVPGHVIRSVYTAPDGMPLFGAGTFISKHSSPLEKRWGGWYVTGTHGKHLHMGNLVVRNSDKIDELDFSTGANITDLDKLIDTTPYLSPHSDIVALMVAEHQTQMHNYITHAGFEGRIAIHYQKAINKALKESDAYRSPGTLGRIASAGDKLLKQMLFVEETPLQGPIVGTSGFAAEFAKRGPFDSKGRSLRDFDLKTRMFKYPCSYQIYSESFDSLPPVVKQHVYRRLWEVLTGKETGEEFTHLSGNDRKAILEILLETKTGLPDYWKSDSVRKLNRHSSTNSDSAN
ncbi:MAG: hypothetical protein IID46_05505 [Planctomycetes bacterium]|nr:hypothetical protein [Planctomycetota bacterium]